MTFKLLIRILKYIQQAFYKCHKAIADYRQTDTQTDKPVGFYGPIAPPSSERPQFRMPAVRNAPELRSQHCTTPRRRFNYNIPASVVLLQQCHCRNCHRGKTSKCISSVSFLRIESNFFTMHRRHRRKNDEPEF